MNIEVRDYFHDMVESEFSTINSYSFFVDAILYALLGYYYYIGNADLYQILVKFIVIIIILRFMLSSLTDYQIYTTDTDTPPSTSKQASRKLKRYFQMNFYLAVFTITILIMMKLKLLNDYFAIFLIVMYGLMSSAVGNNFTVDNLFTIITILAIYNLNFDFLKIPSLPTVPTLIHTSPPPYYKSTSRRSSLSNTSL